MHLVQALEYVRNKGKSEIQLEVINKQRISKNIIRFIFDDKNKQLNKEHESAYLKLQFTDKSQETRARSYTVRSVDKSLHQIAVDFVVHGDEGPASAWALNANVGDTIKAMGPGPAKLVDKQCDWFFIVGDMTSLPAIAANIKQLPSNAKGYALIEVAHESDIQYLEEPEGLEVQWLLNHDYQKSVDKMLAAIAEKTWHQGTPYLWVASEFSVARALREYFREEKGITKNRYVSSYWKYGETDEGNKKAKKEDGGF